jgi:hypothetical protein
MHRRAARPSAAQTAHALQRALRAHQVCHVHACKDASIVQVIRRCQVRVGINVEKADALLGFALSSVLPKGREHAW